MDLAGHRAQTRVTQDAWSSPRYVQPWPKSPRVPCRHRGPWARAKVIRVAWRTPQYVRPGPKSPRKAGRPRGFSDLGPSRPGWMVDTADCRTWAGDPLDNCSKLRVLGHGPESPGTPGRPREPSDKGPSGSGLLVDPGGNSEKKCESPGTALWHRGPRARSRVARESWWRMRAVGNGPESPGTAGRFPRAIGLWPDSSRTAGQYHRASNTSQRHSGQLVDLGGPKDQSTRRLGKLYDTAGPQAQSRVTRDSWSTPGPSGTGPSRPRGLINTAGHLI